MSLKSARRFASNETGSVAIEYGLIVALISISIISMTESFGESLVEMISAAASAIASAFG